MLKNRKSLVVIILANLVLLAAAGVFFLHGIRHLPIPDQSLSNVESWRSTTTVYRDQILYINDELRDSGTSADLLWGPYLPLQQGSYTAVIEYIADEDQLCYVGDRGSSGEIQHYHGSDGILSRFKNQISYQFEISEDVSEFQLVIVYSGKGDFGVRSISLSPNSNRVKRLTTIMIGVILLADSMLVFSTLAPEKKKTVLALAGVTLLISLPIFVFGIFKGHDIDVHYLRIEALVQALRSKQFPARVSSLPLFGQGYPFSIYYNDIFLYFPALLRLLGFSVTAAYKAYVFAVNLLTVILSYVSFRAIFKSRKTGLLLTLVYVTASYRFINVYVRAAVGEFTAQAFLPLLALAFFRIYSDEPVSSRQGFGNAVLLTAALSGIIGAHMLSVIMTAALMVPVCLVLIKRTLRKQTLLTFIGAAVLTLLVNLYFLIPFVDYYFNVPTMIGELVSGSKEMIQKAGIFPGQLFAFFQRMVGNADVIPEGRFQMTPGLVLMAVYVYALYLRIVKGGTHRFRFLLAFSGFVLLLTTDIFPWNGLVLRSRVFGLLAQIQFPWRFLGFAILFMTLLAGDLQEDPELCRYGRIIVGASVVMITWMTASLFSTYGTWYIHDTSSVDPKITGHEYLLQGTDYENYYPYTESEGMETAEIRTQNSYRLDMYCKTDSSSGEHRVTMPLFDYRGYRVLDDAGQEIPHETGSHLHISFLLPDGYDGRVTAVFREPKIWTVGMYVSAVSVFCLCGWALFRRRNA